MELEYQTHPIPIVHQSRAWHNQDTVGGPVVPTSTSTFVSRRRSVINHAPPPGPPPSQPIPSVPALPTTHYGLHDRAPGVLDYDNGTSSQIHAYSRPSGSPNLVAIASYSQARLAAASSSGTSPPPSASSSSDNLSDPPPRSMLRANIQSRQTATTTHDIAPDRLLLSPPESRPSESRPSSRRALTKALELAREAVRLDSTNDDPYAAVVAYGHSVALLSQVMERVMRGEDSTESHRKQNGRRRSVVAQEEEVRRLKAIHDTYAERMNILSSIYSIPVPQYSPPSVHSSSFSHSSNSTRPSSPASTSPTSDSSDSGLVHASVRHRSGEVPRNSGDTVRAQERDDDELSAEEAIGTALSTSTTIITGGRVPSASSPSAHPYAFSAVTPATPASASSASARLSATPAARSRARASSILPPPAPPPTTTLPPTPPGPPAEPALLSAQDTGRLRGSSISHSRNNSGGRLSALPEERREDGLPSSDHILLEEPTRSRFMPLQHNHDDHPLPPLPTPSSPEIATTPRLYSANGQVSEPASPHASSHFTTPRPRGGSTFSSRSEATPTKMPPLINTSPVMGTISQRRVKTSAPPSSTPSSSPTDSTTSAASVPSMGRVVNALPASALSSAGRTRASSQPARRPSVASSTSSYFPPGATMVPGTAPVPRKVSMPYSRLNPNAPPSISVNTALMSPPLGPMAPLVPPPPIPYTNIPTAPLSPLPSLAPPDPLRKPYHMMSLLRQTMTSKTGGYITRRLHVPQEVWSQGGAKLTNIPEKIRIVEVLCSALEELQNWSVEYFGAGSVSSGMALGIGAIGRREGEGWSIKMEEFANVCDGVVGGFGKKLGVGEGFVMKKSSGVTAWRGKLLDKFTNGKNLDSPASYVQGLSKLFQMVQILDEHTKAATSIPPAPLYAVFPMDIRQGLEFKLRHSSEFFAKVVLTFVISDMSLLLDKYVKKCEKWLAE